MPVGNLMKSKRSEDEVRPDAQLKQCGNVKMDRN